MEMATKKIRAAGKAAGTFADNVAAAKRWIDVGVQYMSLSVDTGIFARACREIVSQIKRDCPSKGLPDRATLPGSDSPWRTGNGTRRDPHSV